MSGDAATPSVLIQAHVATAAMLVIAIADDFDTRKIADIARGLNRQIEVVLRTHSDGTAELMQRDQVGTVFIGEQQLALGMTRHVLRRLGLPDVAPLD